MARKPLEKMTDEEFADYVAGQILHKKWDADKANPNYRYKNACIKAISDCIKGYIAYHIEHEHARPTCVGILSVKRIFHPNELSKGIQIRIYCGQKVETSLGFCEIKEALIISNHYTIEKGSRNTMISINFCDPFSIRDVIKKWDWEAT